MCGCFCSPIHCRFNVSSVLDTLSPWGLSLSDWNLLLCSSPTVRALVGIQRPEAASTQMGANNTPNHVYVSRSLFWSLHFFNHLNQCDETQKKTCSKRVAASSPQSCSSLGYTLTSTIRFKEKYFIDISMYEGIKSTHIKWWIINPRQKWEPERSFIEKYHS